MCRKSIFVSFTNERLRMTAHEPRYIYREEILRWAWWLHTILVVVWGLNVVVGGWVENGTVELREKKLGLSVVGQCEASRKIEASVPIAGTQNKK